MIELSSDKINSRYEEVKSYLEYYEMYGQPIVDEYSAELDQKVTAITSYLNNVRQLNLDFDVPSLQKIVIDLSSCLYYTQDKLEKLNLLADMSKICYKDKYNSAYLTKQGNNEAGKKFSVPQLQAYADTEAMEENLINFIYTRAAAVLKGKIDSANELLKACSKSLSAEIQSMGIYGQSSKFHM